MDIAGPRNDRGSFRIRRFRSKWDGWIYTPNLTYELQVDWVGAGVTDVTVGTQSTNLQDANLQYDFTDGKKFFLLKAGQFKAPFGRQELTSSGNQQFVDRSIASVLFAPARQIGLQIHGQLGNAQVPDMITWAGGIFNGNGINRSLGENDKYEYTGRVMFSPFGNVGYSESNLEHYDMRFSIGAGYNNNNQIFFPATGDPTGTRCHVGVGHRHLDQGPGRSLRLLRVLLAQHRKPRPGPRRRRPDSRASSAGSSATTSRSPDGCPRPTSTRTGTTATSRSGEVGMSYYFNKHFWKLQADFGETENEALNGADGLPPAQEQGVPDAGAADVLRRRSSGSFTPTSNRVLHENFTLSSVSNARSET